MKFIEHSNSMYKSNNKYVSPKMKKIRKIIIESLIFILVLLVLVGILSEGARNNNSITSLKKYHKLGSYEDYKITYGVSGNGPNIVLFESDIGKTLLEWNKIIQEPLSGVRMIYYDRLGYGGSDAYKKHISVELQSEILDSLVSNTGYEGNYILVSEGYGSLIHLEYLKNHKSKVNGMILINPVLFHEDAELGYFESAYEKLSLNLLKIFSNLGLPRVVHKVFDKLSNPYIEIYEKEAISRNKENYISRMMSRDYYDTVLKENSSMKKYLKNKNLNDFGVYDIPVIIVDSEKNKSDEYEKFLRDHFTNLEVIYFEDLNNFSYDNSEYIINLISNLKSRIEER